MGRNQMHGSIYTVRSKNVGLYETLLKQRLVSGKNNALTSLKWLNNEAIPIDEFT